MLREWEEIVGRLINIRSNSDGTETLTVAVHSRIIEVNVSCNMNLKQFINHEIGVLKTDDPQRPYLVRRVRRL